MQNKNTRQKAERKNVVYSFFLSILTLFFSLAAHSQCAMCRAALQGEGNVKKAAAVNNGIVYLMVIPYLLVGAIGYAIYRMNKKQ